MEGLYKRIRIIRLSRQTLVKYLSTFEVSVQHLPRLPSLPSRRCRSRSSAWLHIQGGLVTLEPLESPVSFDSRTLLLTSELDGFFLTLVIYIEIYIYFSWI